MLPPAPLRFPAGLSPYLDEDSSDVIRGGEDEEPLALEPEIVRLSPDDQNGAVAVVQLPAHARKSALASDRDEMQVLERAAAHTLVPVAVDDALKVLCRFFAG